MDGPIGPSASKVWFTPTNRGAPGARLPGVSPDSVRAVEEILQENHDKHHIFFNNSGYHNHIAHHILALYAVGATPDALRAAYEHNQTYQRPLGTPSESVVVDISKNWQEYLGKREHYTNFLTFFTKEVEARGIEGFISHYLLSGSPLADDLLVRMFGGFVHGFIHFGYGVEFGSAPIIAEAFALAACTDGNIGNYLLKAEKKAKEKASSEPEIFLGDGNEDFVSLRNAVFNNPELRTAAEWSDSNKIDGLLARAAEEIIEIGGRVRVKPENLNQKMKESINLSAQLCGGAIRRDKKIRFDFYLMHSVNSSVFLPTLMAQEFIPIETKCRLIEWKTRYDLALYASRRAPEILLDEIENYKSAGKHRDDGNPWMGIFERGVKLKDDGHTIKLLRAIMMGEEISHGEMRDGMLTGAMWRNFASMVIDSVEGESENDRWIRSAGFDEAWVDVPSR